MGLYGREFLDIYPEKKSLIFKVGRFRVESNERNKLQVSSTTLIYMFFLPKRSKYRKRPMGRDSFKRDLKCLCSSRDDCPAH